MDRLIRIEWEGKRSQKIIPREKDGILGEAEEEAMEIENVTEQVKQSRVGLKVLDKNRMVRGGKEQIGICTRTERRWKRVCRKSQGRKGANNEGNMENEVMKGNKRFMPIDEEKKREMSDQQGKKARAVYVQTEISNAKMGVTSLESK